MSRVVGLGLSVAVGCGYATSGRVEPLPVALHVVDEVRVDVDAPILVDAALRRSIARRRDLTVVSSSSADARLVVRLLSVDHRFAPTSEPRLRSPEYEIRVRLSGRLEGSEGRGPVRGPIAAEGRATYIARAGPLERSDGAYRTFLDEAVNRAVETLLLRVSYEIDPRFTSGGE